MTDKLEENIFRKGFLSKDDFEKEPAGLLEYKQLGKHRIIKLIGRGGLGDVYLAEDASLNRLIALKILTRVGGQDLTRFHREATLTAKLDHPNIVKIYEIAEHDNIHYISMQYIDGQSLDKKDLTVRQKIDVIRQVALALDQAHRVGIIHRDVKPANILLDREGRPYLTDFGIAKQVSLSGARSNISVSGMIIGTPSYMSPEQARGEIDKVDDLSDVYSLGATLYFLLTNCEPHGAGTAIEIIEKIQRDDPVEPRKLNKDIPIELEAIILKAMERDRQKRYQSTFELAQDLGFYLEGKSTIAKTRSVISKILRKLKRKKVTVAIALACVIVLLTAGIMAYLKTKEYQRHILNISEKLNDCERKLNEFDSLFYMLPFNITTKYYLFNDVIKTCYELLTGNDVEVTAQAYFYIGSALFRKGRLEEAHQNLSKAIDLKEQPIFFLERAKVGLEIYQEKLDVATCAGTAQQVQEQYKSWKENAKKDIQKYLESNPDLSAVPDCEQRSGRPTAQAGEKAWLNIYAHAMILHCELSPDVKNLVKELIGKVTRQQTAEMWKLYAEICSSLKDHEAAIEAYKKALEIRRNDYNLHIGLGNTYLFAASLLSSAPNESIIEYSIECFNNAIEEFSSALFINPLSDIAYARRAQARRGIFKFSSAEKDLDEAIDDCTEAVKINPDSALALSLRCELYSLKALNLATHGQVALELLKSIDVDLEAALKNSQDNEVVLEICAFGLLNIGNTLVEQGEDPTNELDKAVQIYEKISNRHKECLKITGQSSLRCLFIVNNMASILNHKTACLLAKNLDPTKEVNRSIELLTKAINKTPDYIASYFNMAISYQHKAQYLINRGINPGDALEESMRNLRKAIEINADYDELYIRLGMVYWLKLEYSSKIKKLDESSAKGAIENFTRAIDMIGRQPSADTLIKLSFLHELRGNCYHKIREKEKAISDWQEAMQLQPHMRERFLKLIQNANQTD